MQSGKDVRRLLPAFPMKMIGPFIFFDHFGPVRFEPGRGADVRPHPHIGLATVTYLFDGAMTHRDSLGSVQRIEPGDINWMTAGSGIVHSERTPAEERARGHVVHGIQTWVALPKAHEQDAPTFTHHPAATLPEIEFPGVMMHLLAGTAFGGRAPALTYSPMFYIAARMDASSGFDLPPEHEERALYVVEGEVRVADTPVPPLQMAVLEPWTAVHIEAASPGRILLLGGSKMDGDRLIWWNFVASSKELIEAASQRWREQAYPPVPDETEFIPLPD